MDPNKLCSVAVVEAITWLALGPVSPDKTASTKTLKKYSKTYTPTYANINLFITR
jgi:hypothetical protein